MKEIMGRVACLTILCIAVLVKVSIVNGDNTVASRTYIHTLKDGTKLTCNLCPPGTYFLDDCSVDGGDAKCETCPDGQYNGPGPSRAISCAKCDKTCKNPEREIIIKGCTTTSNISCQCKEGFTRQSGSDPDRLCIVTKPCPAGEGVVQPGNATTQTVCKPCGKGFFSANESATEKCKPCSMCPEDQVVESECRPDADTVCGPKSNVGTVIAIAVGVGSVTVAVIVVLTCVFWKPCAKFRKHIRCCSVKSDYEKCSQNGVHVDETRQSDVVLELNGHYPDSPGRTQNGHDSRLQNGCDPSVQNGHGTRAQNGHGTRAQNGHGTRAQNGHITNNGERIVYDRHQDALLENGTVGSAGHAVQREDVYPIDKQLLEVFNKLREDLANHDYQHFFRLLLPSDPDKHISEMVINYMQPYKLREVIYRLLVRWVNLVKEDATIDKIVDALKEWGRPDLAAKYSQNIPVGVQNKMAELKDHQG